MAKAGGFFHQIKEKLFQGEKHVDSEYETAYTQFSRLSDSLHKLKASATAYSNATYAVLFNGGSAAVEFANLLEDPATENGYEVLSKQLLQAHQALGNDRQTALTQRIQEQVMQPLDAIILGYLELNGRVAKRNEMHGNFEYYLAKVAELTRERDERGSKGKPESSSQREKHDRNQGKLDAARTEYQSYSQPLIADLHAAWNNRATAVGPILAAFASIEKEFIQIYGAQLDSVHPEQVGIVAGQAGAQRISSTPQPAVSASSTSPVVGAIPGGGAGSSSSSSAAPNATYTQTVVTTQSTNVTPTDAFGDINQQHQTSGQQQQQPHTSSPQQMQPQQMYSQQMPQQQQQMQPQQRHMSQDMQPQMMPPQQMQSQMQPQMMQQPQMQQEYQPQQQQQHAPNNSFEQDVAAGGVNSGASLSQSLAASSALPAIEQHGDTVGAPHPQPNLPPIKSEHEDESKRQRFEEEGKLQQQQQGVGI